MSSMHILPSTGRHALSVRLRKIEGQAKGIERMIEDGRDCLDVMTQISAMRAAANALEAVLLEDFALHCVQHPEDFASPERAVEEAIAAVLRSSR